MPTIGHSSLCRRSGAKLPARTDDRQSSLPRLAINDPPELGLLILRWGRSTGEYDD